MSLNFNTIKYSIEGHEIELKDYGPFLISSNIILGDKIPDFVDSKRVIIVSVDSLENWKWNSQVLFIPFEKMYISLHESFKLPQTIQAMQNLPILQNAASWVRYGEWFLEELNQLYQFFHEEALEEYVLESRFDDFRHEINSIILQRILFEIQEVDQSQEAPFEKEKKRIKLHLELAQIVNSMHGILKELARQEKLINHLHPEFHSIQAKARAFYSVLENQLNYPQQLYHLAVLSKHLNVTTVLTGEQAHLAFAVFLAVQYGADVKRFCSAFFKKLHHIEQPPQTKLNPQWSEFILM